MNWQPIKTAQIDPFDKERWYNRFSDILLLWNGHYCQIGSYNYTKHGKGNWKADGRLTHPTHWMALPGPPVKVGA